MRPIYIYGVTATEQEKRLLKAGMRDAGIENAEIAYKKIEDPNAVIVTLGDQALRVYTYKINTAQGHGYVLKEEGKPTIIPCIHPSIVCKTLEDYIYFVWSFQKAKMVADGEESPQRTFIIKPTFEQTLEYIDGAMNSEKICLDIEKEIYGEQRMTCLGIATSPTSAIAIPFWAGTSNYWNEDQERVIREKLKALLGSPKIVKIIHNYIFDTLCLDFLYDIKVEFPIYDTMLAAHILHPNLKKGLKELARLYTFVEPWKGGQDWSAKNNIHDLWYYNAQDTAITFEIYEKITKIMKEDGFDAVYEKRVAQVMPLVYEACRTGVTVDKEEMVRVRERMSNILNPTDARLTELASSLIPAKEKYVQRKLRKAGVQYYQGIGEPTYTHTAKGIVKDVEYKSYESITIDPSVKSFKDFDRPVFELVKTTITYNPNSIMQMRTVLDAAGIDLPTKIDKKTYDNKIDTGHIAMLKIARKYPGNELINLYLNRGKASKIKNTYSQLDLDEDGRFRFSINIAGTKSARFSSSKTPWKTGGNIQNMPREGHESEYSVRQMFVPSPGYTDLVQVDLKAAEARVVAWLSGDEHVQGIFDRDEDIHVDTANAIYGEDITVHDKESEIFNEKRYMGKMANHALAYGMGPYLFSNKILEETGKAISIAEAKEIIERYFEARWKMREWHRSIERELNVNKCLVSPHGRKISFYGRVDDKVVREALSWIPQCVVADSLNEAWVNFAWITNTVKNKHRVLMQGHDSLLIETNDVEECKEFINTAFKVVKFNLNGEERQIPWDIKVGPNWRDLK